MSSQTVVSSPYPADSPQAYWDQMEHLIQAIQKEAQTETLQFDLNEITVVVLRSSHLQPKNFQQKLEETASYQGLSPSVVRTHRKNLKIKVKIAKETDPCMSDVDKVMRLVQKMEAIEEFQEIFSLKAETRSRDIHKLVKEFGKLVKEVGLINEIHSQHLKTLQVPTQKLEKMTHAIKRRSDDPSTKFIKRRTLQRKIRNRLLAKTRVLNAQLEDELDQTAQQYGFVGAASGIPIQDFLS